MGVAYVIFWHSVRLESAAATHDGGAGEARARGPGPSLQRPGRQAATAYLRAFVVVRRWHSTVLLSSLVAGTTKHDCPWALGQVCCRKKSVFPHDCCVYRIP